ncbi:MAG: hypothetical protein BWX87_02640 [Bacteroidetes bacterium ADurb.Bin123]|nr:MAG: hypothetical protein BWX87_02640 [Bacteroidetes bacterium ADurb.Bin123]
MPTTKCSSNKGLDRFKVKSSMVINVYGSDTTNFKSPFGLVCTAGPEPSDTRYLFP